VDIQTNVIEPIHTEAGDSRLDLNMYSNIPAVIKEQKHEETQSTK
jgi:hypothetical protein